MPLALRTLTGCLLRSGKPGRTLSDLLRAWPAPAPAAVDLDFCLAWLWCVKEAQRGGSGRVHQTATIRLAKMRRRRNRPIRRATTKKTTGRNVSSQKKKQGWEGKRRSYPGPVLAIVRDAKPLLHWRLQKRTKKRDDATISVISHFLDRYSLIFPMQCGAFFLSDSAVRDGDAAGLTRI